jgi:predicted signal transduction protein with EAL and GGDEF domain
VWGAPAESASKIAESLLVALERPLVLDGVPLFVTACAGVSTSMDPQVDLNSLFREAEVALYTAKEDGPGLVRCHDGRAGEQTAARLRMRAELRDDLADGGANFVMHYQPILSLGDGSMLAVEALVRWRHDGRLVPPGVFLPEVVRAGQMADLTRLVLHRSLEEMKGLPWTVPVTVNVPPDLMGQWIVDQAQVALVDVGVPADHLIVEITEEAIIRNPEEVANVLMTLRESGVRSLLDDFGSGWSGLSSLRDFIVDGLKIDASFVDRMTTDAAAMAIVHGVVGLADELGMVVICEGAETQETLAALKGFDRAYVQGFGSARPMPIEDLSRWMILGHQHCHAWSPSRASGVERRRGASSSA